MMIVNFDAWKTSYSLFIFHLIMETNKRIIFSQIIHVIVMPPKNWKYQFLSVLSADQFVSCYFTVAYSRKSV